MALYNEILVNRYSALLNKLFGVRSGASPAPTLATDVMPVFNVDDPGAFELNWLREVRSYCWTDTQGGGVGVPHFRLRNPASSGQIAILDSLQLSGYGAVNLLTKISANPAGTVGIAAETAAGLALDLRQVNTAGTAPLNSACLKSSLNTEAVVALATTWQVSHVNSPANDFGPADVNVAFVLPPGATIDIWSLGITAALVVSGRLRERSLAERELSA